MKAHRFDAISFIFGAIFSAIGLVFLLAAEPWKLFVDGVELRWIFPLLALIGGAMLLVSVLRQGPAPADGTSDSSEPNDTEIAEAEAELSEPPSL